MRNYRLALRSRHVLYILRYSDLSCRYNEDTSWNDILSPDICNIGTSLQRTLLRFDVANEFMNDVLPARRRGPKNVSASLWSTELDDVIIINASSSSRSSRNSGATRHYPIITRNMASGRNQLAHVSNAATS